MLHRIRDAALYHLWPYRHRGCGKPVTAFSGVREPELSAGEEFIKVNQAVNLKTLKTTAINLSSFTIIIETIKTIVTIKTSFLIC
jgi:hypothetical protein